MLAALASVRLAAQISVPDAVRQAIEQAQASRPMVRLRGPDDLPIPPARLPVFFPPEPPALGAAIDVIAPLYTPTWDAPIELRSFIGEPFYAILGTILAEENLSERQRRRLAQFTGLRRDALAHLRASLDSAAAASSGRPDAEKIETEAELLRSVLYSAELDWNRYRDFRIERKNELIAASLRGLREYKVLRAAAFFGEGLSPAQRRLLHEYVLELATRPPGAEFPEPRAAPGALVWFLPETSRLTIPPAASRALCEEFDEFLLRKHRLKSEIAEEVLRSDPLPESKRTRTLAALAKRHAPEITELEHRAESIRRALAGVPRAAHAALPPAIEAMAGKYRNDRAELQAELSRRLRALRQEKLSYKPDLERLTWDSIGMKNIYIPASDPDVTVFAPSWVVETPQQIARPAAVSELLRLATDKFAHDTARETAALEASRKGLFLAVARELQLIDSSTQLLSPTASQAVATRLQWLSVRQRETKFQDYETAMLRPGLSPADRRLLFKAALVSLDLPLPAAVRRPVGRYE